MKPRDVRVGAMVLAILMLIPTSVQLVSGQNMGPPIVAEFLQIVDDPQFDSQPYFGVNGSSDEFTTSYYNSTGGDDCNRAILNWTHIANTSLDFTTPPDYDYPECYDFAFLYQDLTWDYEVEPYDVKVKVEYRMNFTGDFSTLVNPEGEEMAKVHFWFRDSSGHMVFVGSYNAYSSYLYERWISINLLDEREVFRGMIEDSTGVQEDPSDVFSLGVALVPSDSFRNYSSTEPWRTYNGSVTLEVSNLECHVVADITNNVMDTLPTMTNQTWVSPLDENFKSFDMANDGTVYAVATSSNYEAGILQHSLVKWDQAANIAWNVTWNESRYTTGRDISIHENNIYTTGDERDEDGNKNAFIAKWDSLGNLVWKRVFDTGWDECGFDIEADSSGNIYLLGNRLFYNETSHDYTDDSFLIKFDESGNQLWNHTSEIWINIWRIYIHPNGTLFSIDFPDNGLYRWLSDGTPTLVTSEGGISDIAFSSNGDFYILARNFHEDYIHSVYVVNETGQFESVYNYNYTTIFPDPWHPLISPDSIEIHNESIYFIIKHEWYDYYYELIKIDLEGNKIWNKTILDLHWRAMHSGSRSFFMRFGTNGLLYIGSSIWTADGGMDIGLAILNPEGAPYPPSIPTSPTGFDGGDDNFLISAVIIIGCIGAVIIVAAILRKVKKGG